MANRDDHIAQFRRSKNRKNGRSPRTPDTPSHIQVVEDVDNYNDDAFDDDDDYQDEEEYDDNEEPWLDDEEQPDFTPEPSDDQADYDDNYDTVYDDADYAAAPPKKKKYRQSDANIGTLSYIDAKKKKDKQIEDKHARRYSKYDAVPEISEHKDENKARATPSAIDLSITSDIECGAIYDKTPTKEMSVFYNKKTKDKYNEFEMNTYDSSDSGSNSDDTMKKYLKDPLTPAPDTAYLKSNPEPITPATDTNGASGLKIVKEKKPNKKNKKQQKAFTERLKKNTNIKSKKKKKFTLKQFMKVDLLSFVRKYDGDNFDVAKAVCKHFDDLTQDTDTVTIVSDKAMGPNTAYWSKGDFNRVEKDCDGKYIMVYRACKHVPCSVKVNQDVFESCVKGLCMDNLGHSQLIADKLDSVFGEGCHVSLASHDEFEVFCRYSDGYICEVELPSNDFVVAWRR